MSNSTPAHSVTHSTPPLPTELISQILHSPQLSKPDLARCCLVNRQFLCVSQELLYRTISIRLYEQGQGWHYVDASLSLLRTLGSNLALNSTVSELYLKGLFSSQGVFDTTVRCNRASLLMVVTFTFDMLDNLVTLDLERWMWERAEIQNVVVEYGHRWKGLRLRNGTLAKEDSKWTALPNLAELDCDQLSRRPLSDVPIPESIEVLKIKGNRPEIVRGSPNSRLRILDVVGSPETLSNIGDFPELQHLHIFRGLECQPLLPSSAFSAFSQISHLRSLSLALWSVGDPILSATLPSLLAHLPRSLDRLDFPERTPIEILSTYFQTSTSRPFRCLGYSRNKYQDETEKHLLIAQLGNLAFSKGVGLECI